MIAIIQESLKKINRQISDVSIISLFITTILVITFTFYINIKTIKDGAGVTYTENNSGGNVTNIVKSNIFASVNGKTYTYSWCSGAGNIKEENKIYFASESEAQATGRNLSKLCN